jgi:hypothetical protein
MRREFNSLHVDAGLGGVALKRGDLSAMAVLQVFPLYLVGYGPNKASIVGRRQIRYR